MALEDGESSLMETLVEKRSQRFATVGDFLGPFLADICSFLMAAPPGLASAEKSRLAAGDFLGVERGGEKIDLVGVPNLLDLKTKLPFSSTALTKAPPSSLKGTWLRVAMLWMLWKDFLSLEGEANRSKGIGADAVGNRIGGWRDTFEGMCGCVSTNEKVRRK